MTIGSAITGSYFTKKGFDLGFKVLGKLLNSLDGTLVSDRTEFENSISTHQKEVEIWSREIETKDLIKNKFLDKVFVPLDIYLCPKYSVQIASQPIERKKLEETLSKKSGNAVLLGHPGSGKTTASKHICRQMLSDDKIFKANQFPICLRFRDLNHLLPKKESSDDMRILSGIVIPWILSVFGVQQNQDVSLSNLSNHVRCSEKVAIGLLEHFKPLIIFDGFDEIATSTARNKVLEEIKSLSNKLSATRFILTSRIGEFPYILPNCETFEISELSENQINQFAKFYLADKNDQLDFVKQIKLSPFYDTTIRPLTLVWLCAVYTRTKQIPEKPKSVYKKVVSLLLEEWDEQRMISRKSRYTGFQSDRKFELLSRMSYYLTITYKREVFSSSELERAYRSMCEDFDLPAKEDKQVINEIESHNGLLIQAAYSKYCFTHKSIQEYLTADYIVRLPDLPRNAILPLLPNELAIAISLSSSPSNFLTSLISDRLIRFSKHRKNLSFLRIFLSRLIQERPEFNANQASIRALVLLYSTYLNSGQDPRQQLLFYDDRLLGEFEGVMDNLCKRNKTHNPFRDYKEAESVVGWNGTEIVRLILRKDQETSMQRVINDDRSVLPQYLMCRRSFLDRFQKITSGSSTSPEDLFSKSKAKI